MLLNMRTHAFHYLIDPTCKENWVLRKPGIFKLVKMRDNLRMTQGCVPMQEHIRAIFFHPHGMLHCLRLSALFKQEQIYLCRQLFTSHAIKVYQ